MKKMLAVLAALFLASAAHAQTPADQVMKTFQAGKWVEHLDSFVGRMFISDVCTVFVHEEPADMKGLVIIMKESEAAVWVGIQLGQPAYLNPHTWEKVKADDPAFTDCLAKAKNPATPLPPEVLAKLFGFGDTK